MTDPEVILATHQERVRDAQRRARLFLIWTEDQEDKLALASGEEPEFRSCPTPLERMKAMLR